MKKIIFKMSFLWCLSPFIQQSMIAMNQEQALRQLVLANINQKKKYLLVLAPKIYDIFLEGTAKLMHQQVLARHYDQELKALGARFDIVLDAVDQSTLHEHWQELEHYFSLQQSFLETLSAIAELKNEVERSIFLYNRCVIHHRSLLYQERMYTMVPGLITMKFTTAAPETDASRESIHIQPPMLVPQPAIPMSQGIMNTFMQHLDNKNVATSSTSRMLPESREKHALFEEFKQNHNLTHAQTSFLIKLVGKCIEQAADITYDLITQVYENNLEHFGKDKEDPS